MRGNLQVRTASNFASFFLSSGQLFEASTPTFHIFFHLRKTSSPQPGTEVPLSFSLFRLCIVSQRGVPASAFEEHITPQFVATLDTGPRQGSGFRIRTSAKWRWCVCIFSPAAVNSQLNGFHFDSVSSFSIHGGSPDPRRGGCTITTRRGGVAEHILRYREYMTFDQLAFCLGRPTSSAYINRHCAREHPSSTKAAAKYEHHFATPTTCTPGTRIVHLEHLKQRRILLIAS
jgi:hypothetical protein